MTFREQAVRRIVNLDPFPQPPIIRLRYPIVLMHGFGLVASLRRGGHLHDEAMHLRLQGVWAFAPNVASYNTVKARSTMWEERIEHVLAETGASRLNLIAHSMGGLDARYLISHRRLHRVVASLTTISTPHHGTPVAHLVLDQPNRLRQLMSEFANFVSSTALVDATSDLEQALRELTPEHVTEHFNEHVENHPAVRYWSYAGVAGRGTDTPINPFLRLFNAWLYSRIGLNDGMVPAKSARWGTFLGTIEADHALQVGISGIGTPLFDAHAFYANVARFLADEGF